MIHKFDPVIYPRKVWITYDATKSELDKEFPEGDGTGRHFEDIPSHTDAMVYFTRNKENYGGVLMRFKGKAHMTMSIVTHESIHCANGILAYIGSGVNTRDDEHQAYLAGWVAECCEKVKLGRKKK